MTSARHATGRHQQAFPADEFAGKSSLDADRFGAALTDGIVTLTGQVASFAEKKDALRAVLRVLGVRVGADEAAVQDPDQVRRMSRVLSANKRES